MSQHFTNPVMQADTTEADATETMSLRDFAALLVKHYNYHEGLYDLVMRFQVAIGGVGPNSESVMPGAMIGVAGIGIMKVENIGPHTVNAAEVNPATETSAKKPTKKKMAKRNS